VFFPDIVSLMLGLMLNKDYYTTAVAASVAAALVAAIIIIIIIIIITAYTCICRDKISRCTVHAAITLTADTVDYAVLIFLASLLKSPVSRVKTALHTSNRRHTQRAPKQFSVDKLYQALHAPSSGRTDDLAPQQAHRQPPGVT